MKRIYERSSDIDDLSFMLKTLLGYDCEDTAARLIERFGSFSGVFRASRRELMDEGITERTALFFTCARPTFRRALSRSGSGIIDSEAALAAEALTLFPDLDMPHTFCIHLDKYGVVLAKERIDNANIVRAVLGGAARTHADRAAIVSCRPSRSPNYIELFQTAEHAARALELIGTKLLDYTEYRDFKIFSLRRAVNGSPLRFDIDDADENKLTCIDGFADKIAEHIKLRPKATE